MKKAKSKEKIKRSHIKKISKITNVEDLFILTNHFKEEDNKKLFQAIKDLHIGKKKSEVNPNVLKIIKENKGSENIRENIIQALIEEIENTYADIKDKGSEKRKKGKDTLVAELKLMSAQYKLKLFKATKDKRDYLKIKKLLNEADRDLGQ